MTSSSQAWTLIARFSNNDAKKWMQDSGKWWYDRSVGAGHIADHQWTQTCSRQPSGWSGAANSKSRAVMTLNTPRCCRPQVTVWVERHSGRKSPVTVTLEMVQFGQRMTAREIAMFNMAASFKQPMDSDKLHAVDQFKAQHKSASGVTGAVGMEQCWWLVEEGVLVIGQITGSQ